ncbi:hypothetical protein HPP92_027614 [Vanilla planifolia]|uniref:Uncharacterized protein n=1 Tax=Vanilla planifolia TaxID=51239 RepID=A0A835PB81_VANPL|nr:hypothetical protein HPP92_027614 [Vanilla planifolia]
MSEKLFDVVHQCYDWLPASQIFGKLLENGRNFHSEWTKKAPRFVFSVLQSISYSKFGVKWLSFFVVHELGHEIRVFTNAAISGSSNEASSPPKDEPDDFYDFTPEDYYRIVANKLGAQSQILKTSKMREAEAAARRARITKVCDICTSLSCGLFLSSFLSSSLVKNFVSQLKPFL